MPHYDNLTGVSLVSQSKFIYEIQSKRYVQY